MAHCTHCGAHVSADFARVFGDGGDVHACQHCATNAGVAAVARQRARGDAAESEPNPDPP